MNDEIISSLDNPVVKEARSLNDKKFRKQLGKFLVDGEKLVREAVSHKMPVSKIFVDSSRASEFEYLLQNFDGKVVFVTSKVLSSISENVTPQGIIAEVEMKQEVNFLPQNQEPILILDRIQDPGNLGTIIRTSVATGIKTVVLIDSVDPYSPKVVRSSSGGIFHLNIFKMSEDEILDYMSKSGHELLVADMGGENIFSFESQSQNFALVIGNEGQGVSEKFKTSGKVISLPMKPQMESLNAGVSASVLLYILLGKKI